MTLIEPSLTVGANAPMTATHFHPHDFRLMFSYLVILFLNRSNL